MRKLKKVFLKIHLASIILLLINFCIKIIFGLSLIGNLILLFKISLYTSGLLLFFLYLKPFKKLSFYFSLYVFSPILIGLSWLIDGISGAILGSLFLFFFVPSDVRFENNEIVINKKFGGLLGRCCDYEVVKKKMFLFEEKAAEFNFDKNIYLKKKDVQLRENYLEIHLVLKDYDLKEDQYIEKDTTIFVLMK
ncbi:hypothetical protein EAH81_15050 [Flavobacterium pectinovorum]|uniref:Uncharacterized protein n=1 Tax=Flavobacterium pectinovorum TaxID=29533 RepID=A0A502EM14_9FLAO|nr:hypothetical protein EAH81_15050 [Flavobacterium pectinovorum]